MSASVKRRRRKRARRLFLNLSLIPNDSSLLPWFHSEPQAPLPETPASSSWILFPITACWHRQFCQLLIASRNGVNWEGYIRNGKVPASVCPYVCLSVCSSVRLFVCHPDGIVWPLKLLHPRLLVTNMPNKSRAGIFCRKVGLVSSRPRSLWASKSFRTDEKTVPYLLNCLKLSQPDLFGWFQESWTLTSCWTDIGHLRTDHTFGFLSQQFKRQVTD